MGCSGTPLATPAGTSSRIAPGAAKPSKAKLERDLTAKERELATVEKKIQEYADALPQHEEDEQKALRALKAARKGIVEDSDDEDEISKLDAKKAKLKKKWEEWKKAAAAARKSLAEARKKKGELDKAIEGLRGKLGKGTEHL